MAALFELADQEFSALNEETEKRIYEATSGGSAESTNPDDELNAFSFLSMVSKFHPNYNFEDQSIDGFVDEIKMMDKDFSFGDLKQACNKYRNYVWEYKQAQRKNDININPFTEIRHVMYAYDKNKFSDMLYPNQREAFSNWLKKEKKVII